MKKIAILLALLAFFLPTAFACDITEQDMGDQNMNGHTHEGMMGEQAHEEVSTSMMGAAVANNMMDYGYGLTGLSFLWVLLVVYFAVGLGYIIYKLNKIEDKLEMKTRKK
ncbi:hypothetical protein HY643_02610 [Candidatus Woesearchaeota archaeon]|nr:hypothetical protein [Candidatus Woesearchaeota archaeon]